MGLTRDQWIGYFSMREAGMSVRAMAPALGVSPTTVQKYLALDSTNDDGSIEVTTRRGIDGKYRPSRRFDTEHRDAVIHDLRSQQQSLRAIAQAVGCSVGTVHRVLAADASTQVVPVAPPESPGTGHVKRR